MDISINENKLDVLNDSNKMNINLGVPKIVTHEKNHANLENLDYEKSGHTGFQPAGDYALKSDIPDVPTKVSELENDSGFLVEEDLKEYAKTTDIPNVSDFITKDVSNLTNYYNKDYIDEMLGDIEALLGGI